MSIRPTDQPKSNAPIVPSTIPVGTQQGGRASSSSPRSSHTPIYVAGAISIIGILIAVLWPRGSEPPTVQPTTQPVLAVATTVPSATLVPTSIPVTPTPTGPDIAPYLALIDVGDGGGQWSEAAHMAEAALGLSGLRDEDRRLLTQYAITYGLKAVYTEPFRPLDIAQHQRMVDTYLALKKRAKDANIPIDTPLQVASTAYASSQFQLARVALEEALKEESWQPDTDRDITKRYVSTLFGLGQWYVTAPANSPIYQDGLRWLVTSNAVAVKYQTGQSEAFFLLEQKVGPGRWTTITPQASLLLP